MARARAWPDPRSGAATRSVRNAPSGRDNAGSPALAGEENGCDPPRSSHDFRTRFGARPARHGRVAPANRESAFVPAFAERCVRRAGGFQHGGTLRAEVAASARFRGGPDPAALSENRGCRGSAAFNPAAPGSRVSRSCAGGLRGDGASGRRADAVAGVGWRSRYNSRRGGRFSEQRQFRGTGGHSALAQGRCRAAQRSLVMGSRGQSSDCSVDRGRMRGEYDRHASHREDSMKRPRLQALPSLTFLAVFLFSFFTTACGYHTAGHVVQLPENVKTIAVPAFKNETLTYRIEQMLTASVVREFTTRTHYRILNDTGEEADATLRRTVLSTAASPLTYDTATGQAASILVVVSMKVTLTDRSGKVLYQNPAYVFREQYEVSQDLASFFEEDSPAFRRLSQDFARTLVSNILEGC